MLVVRENKVFCTAKIRVGEMRDRVRFTVRSEYRFRVRGVLRFREG